MVVSFSLCIVCDTKVSCHFFAVFVKMKDSRCAEEFVSASPILTGRIRMLDVLGSFGQKMSAIFSLTIWPQAMLQNENTITAFTFVASSLTLLHIDFQIQETFPERVVNPINKRVRSTSLFMGFASFEGNISCI